MKKQNISRVTATALTLLGAVPFWACSLLAWWQPSWVHITAHVHLVYAAMILGFLGGTHWSFGIHHGHMPSLFWAVTPGLLGVLMVFTSSYAALHGVAVILFIAIWQEQRAADNGWWPHWYLGLRVIVTILVIGALATQMAQMTPDWRWRFQFHATHFA